MESTITLPQWLMGTLLLLSAIGVVSFRKPIYASLSFLLSLLLLAFFYLQLSAEFIAIMQILVYAGAILVIFVFVMVLFQDAHQQIAKLDPKSSSQLLIIASITFVVALAFFGARMIHLTHEHQPLSKDFGSVHGIGLALYSHFFFPFEAIILLFLVAVVGSLYIAKKER